MAKKSPSRNLLDQVEYSRNILETIGNTPLILLSKIGSGIRPKILLKMEGFNPGGSVKDRIGIAMLNDAEKKGHIKKGDYVVEPTSGNTGIGMAMACKILGFNLIVTMPDKVSEEKRSILRAYGAEVVVCPDEALAGSENHYMTVAKKISRERNAYLPNQYYNQSNPKAHYETTGPEIWNQTKGKITHFVAGIGTGGTITGIGKFLKEKNKKIRIIGIEPEGSIYKELKEGKRDYSYKSYLTEGIGEDFLPGTTNLEVIDDVLKVSDKDAYNMARRLASEEGILAGSSAGSAVAGALELSKILTEENLVVVIIPDRGERYASKVFNDEWMKEKGFL
ncbi:MAG: cysteine synthase family protein [Thermoplasmataceae archaeon]|jgi:cystathionine beta-synthase